MILCNNIRHWIPTYPLIILLQSVRRGPASAPSSWPSDLSCSSWSPSPSPSSSWWRWSRSTRGPSSSGWAGCWQEELGVRGSSSSFLVLISTRRLTWEQRLTRSLHRRYNSDNCYHWYDTQHHTLDPHQRLGDGVRQRHHVLQGGQRHARRLQRGRLQRVRQAVGGHHPEECAGYNDSGRYSL